MIDQPTRREVIHAFDTTRRMNDRLFEDCYALGYLPEPILDLTYGRGTFWKRLPDLEIVGNDLDPAKGDHHHDFADTPWTDGAFPAVVFDPPYKGGGASSLPPGYKWPDDHYGLGKAVLSPSDLERTYTEGVKEAARLASQFVLVKLQDHVSSGRLQPLSVWATNAALSSGLRLVDSLHVISGRVQPPGTRQVRARHGYSTLLVFEKK